MAISVNKSSLAAKTREIQPMLIVAIIMLFIDQLTKIVIRKTLASDIFRPPIEVIKNFFEISYTENTGAAFGMFGGQNRIFIVVGLIAVVFIFVYYQRLKTSMWMKIALGFLLGGALGNLIDRMFLHYVTDFIRIRWWFMEFRWWPTFNVADTAVFIGAVMLIIGMFKQNRDLTDQSVDESTGLDS